MNKIIETVFYKGKSYTVTNPGELVYETVKRTRSGKSYDYRMVLDQLQGLKHIGPYVKKYLQKNYNISELDYYIIVVLRGDINKLPKCSYVNPYNGKVCNKLAKFKGNFNEKRHGASLFYDGCEDHVINASAQNKQKIAYAKGITGLQKADRSSKVWRNRLREHALKQMAEGNSIFSPDEVRRPDIKKPISNIKISGYNLIAQELGVNINSASIDELILIDKYNYLKKGDSKDTCYLYIAYLSDTDIVKVGVTTDTLSRFKRGYQGKVYVNLETLFTGSRIQVAELEYLVKMKFKDKICLGNEGFSKEVEKDIRLFIKEQIKLI